MQVKYVLLFVSIIVLKLAIGDYVFYFVIINIDSSMKEKFSWKKKNNKY